MTSYKRGTLVVGGVVINNWRLSKERITVLGGLMSQKNLPFLPSRTSLQFPLWGRQREIIIEGRYAFNSQNDAEQNFIGPIEQWVNGSSAQVQDTANYYPMFYPYFGAGDYNSDNTGLQNNYFNVLCDNFQYTYDEAMPSIIVFTIVLREGLKGGPLSDALGGK
jgi:hypothetical protein